jgi:hypothetical protein
MQNSSSQHVCLDLRIWKWMMEYEMRVLAKKTNLVCCHRLLVERGAVLEIDVVVAGSACEFVRYGDCLGMDVVFAFCCDLWLRDTSALAGFVESASVGFIVMVLKRWVVALDFCRTRRERNRSSSVTRDSRGGRSSGWFVRWTMVGQLAGRLEDLSSGVLLAGPDFGCCVKEPASASLHLFESPCEV